MLKAKIRGGMLLIVLDALKDEELHGYKIAEKIEETYGIEKPSSGLIYPILSKLKREGFVEVCKRGEREKKIYRITEKGLRYLEEMKEEVNRIKSTLKKLGEFHKLGGHELMDSIHQIIKNMDQLDEEKKKEISHLMKDFAKKIRFIVEFGGLNE